MTIGRVSMPEQEGEVRARNFGEVNLGLTYQLAMLEAERCIQCPKPFCVDGCPVRVDIPRFIKFLRDGDLPSAAESLLGDNALPCVTGRVCPQETQCEGVCIRGQEGRLGRHRLPRAVRRRLGACSNPDVHARSASPARPASKVGIVGSGPAGLTAAGELAQQGPRRHGLRGVPRPGRRAHLRHPGVPAAQGHRPGRGRPARRARASRSRSTRSSAAPTRSPSCARSSTRCSSPSAPACRCS